MDTKNGIFWPGQLLPNRLEEVEARILVYGYDADAWSGGISNDRIHNHAEQLVATLCASRRKKAAKHPIIFVTHCLGGIIVKRALIYSMGKRGMNTGHLRSIFVSTYGILFLGTPHLGSDISKWSSWVDEVSRTTASTQLTTDNSPVPILDSLKPYSDILQNIERQFIELTDDLHIFYFHEAKPTKLGEVWRYIVDEHSAAPNVHDVERAGIQQDHAHMCKFDDENAPGFDLVTDAIQRYAAAAPEPVRIRWETEIAEQHRKKDVMIKGLLGPMTSGIAQGSLNDRAESAIDRKPTRDLAPFSNRNHAESRQRRYYIVPRERVKVFVRRKAQLKKISAFFSKTSTQQPQVLILHALGGQGKSQIVLEYCQRSRKRYRGIFWVNASSQQLALQSYTRIALTLNDESLAGIADEDRTIERVTTGLADWEEPWLLVFDNYDNPNKFTNIRRFLPQCEHGHVIFTSRRRDLDRLGSLMEVPAMSSDEGVDLLLRRYSGEGEDSVTDIARDIAREIVSRLGGLALAIDQAAAYIAYKRIPPPRLSELLTLYDLKREKILSYKPSNLWEYSSEQFHGKEDQNKALSAFTTWEISLEQLVADNPKYKDEMIHFLTLSAFFNPAKIEESLFSDYWDDEKLREHSEWLRAIGTRNDSADTYSSDKESNGTWDADKFWDTLTRMHGLSLLQNIKSDQQGASFSLHPLIRDWLQLRQQSVYQRDYILESVNVVASIAGTHLSLDSISIDQQAALLPHVDTCLLNDAQLSEAQDRIGNKTASFRIASLLAHYYWKCGRYESAEGLLRRISKDEDVDTTYTIQLCQVLLAQGSAGETVEICHRNLHLRKNKLETKDPQRLMIMACLGKSLCNLGRLEEAEPIICQTLQLRQEVLGRSHLLTLESMSILANALYYRHKYSETEKLTRETLALCGTVRTKYHDALRLNTMSILALALAGQRKYEEAENIQRHTVQVVQDSCGKEHPRTLMFMHNLAWMIRYTKRDEAEELYRYVMQSKKKVLRKGHPTTLLSMKELAALLRRQHRNDEAEKIERQMRELEQLSE
ncbi:MAG: hypothetical protein Q9166_006784 [cf. Caloplaca sp. 2 TL-2023]